MTPPGQRDYSAVRLSRHALERFVERFSAAPEAADPELRKALARTRRLGRNPENGAVAVLAVYRGRVLVAIVQDASCLTVLTWNQFVPRLPEFGRSKLPRKWGRALRRLIEPLNHESECGIQENQKRLEHEIHEIHERIQEDDDDGAPGHRE